MELTDVLSTIGEAISRKAGVESVYGKPIQIGDRTYIPVARIQYGLGGGDNAGIVGGGGGMEATPVGLVELSPQGVQFHAFPSAVTTGAALECTEVASGILQISRAGLPHCWLLFHGGEGALVNAPPDAALSSFLVEQAGHRDITIRYVIINRTDYRHCGALQDVLRIFPEATLVAHRAVEHCPDFPPLPETTDPEPWRASVSQDVVRVREAFDQQIWSGKLGGEPVYLIYAPLRSWTDQVAIFRGALLTGPAGPSQVAPDVREYVLDALEDFSENYQIRQIFASLGPGADGLDMDFLGGPLAFR